MIRLLLSIVLMMSTIAAGQSAGTSPPDAGRAGNAGGARVDTLSGVLPKILRNSGKPYLVVSDIEVPADQTVTVQPGVVLMFRDFTGLHVQGKLVALGTRRAPIIFTSEFDTLFNRVGDNIPNPFDWNGIYLHSGSIGTSLEYCKIFYSVYGIKSDTKFIRINPAQFRNNGKSDFTLEGKIISTGNGPYSYVLDMKDARIDGVPVVILRDPAAPRRNVFRYTGLAAVLAGAAGCVYFGQSMYDVHRDFGLLSRDDDDNIANHSSSMWNTKRDRRNRLLTYTAVSGAASLVGLAGFVWTFSF